MNIYYKKSIYKTAKYNGEFVALLRYHKHGDYYTVQTSEGILNIYYHWMTNYCL